MNKEEAEQLYNILMLKMNDFIQTKYVNCGYVKEMDAFRYVDYCQLAEVLEDDSTMDEFVDTYLYNSTKYNNKYEKFDENKFDDELLNNVLLNLIDDDSILANYRGNDDYDYYESAAKILLENLI